MSVHKTAQMKLDTPDACRINVFRIPLKPALGDVCSLANYSVAYEDTQSNRVSDFRDFVCSLFPKAILFDFYFKYMICDNSQGYTLMKQTSNGNISPSKKTIYDLFTSDQTVL